MGFYKSASFVYGSEINDHVAGKCIIQIIIMLQISLKSQSINTEKVLKNTHFPSDLKSQSMT